MLWLFQYVFTGSEMICCDDGCWRIVDTTANHALTGQRTGSLVLCCTRVTFFWPFFCDSKVIETVKACWEVRGDSGFSCLNLLS